MIRYGSISVAHELLVLALTAAALISLWGDADKHREAKPLAVGGIEFSPNRRSYYAWPLLVAYLTYATIHWVRHVPRNRSIR